YNSPVPCHPVLLISRPRRASRKQSAPAVRKIEDLRQRLPPFLQTLRRRPQRRGVQARAVQNLRERIFQLLPFPTCPVVQEGAEICALYGNVLGKLGKEGDRYGCWDIEGRIWNCNYYYYGGYRSSRSY